MILSRIINTSVIKHLPYINVLRRDYLNKAGNIKEWYMVSRPGTNKAVMIVPTMIDENGVQRLVVTNEFRVPVADYEWGFPAGLMDKESESVEDVARRELHEETGLDIVSIEKISPFVYSAAGMSDTTIAIVYAIVEGSPTNEFCEESEDIETFVFNQKQIATLISNHKLHFGAKAWVIMDQFAQHGKVI
jgi:ADP-ribose pyrophosphatase